MILGNDLALLVKRVIVRLRGTYERDNYIKRQLCKWKNNSS